ncbi:MAG: B12-binding domain-containing radical SAM protein, partial [Candidatus Thorarchaeota archaeon]
MIYPNKTMTTRAPLGIGYLSSYLKAAGHEFTLFDTTFIKCGNYSGDDKLREKNLQVINPDFEKLGLVEKDIDVFLELEKALEEFRPDLITMSTVDPNHAFGLELLNKCKELYPDVPVLVGGPLATLVPEDIIVEDCIDAIGMGECEEKLVEFCNNLEQGGWEETLRVHNFWVKDHSGKIHKNLTSLPDITYGLPPDMAIYDPRHFLRPLGGRIYKMATVVWTRGCVFHCAYCANETFYKQADVSAKQYYRKKDTLMLVDELADFKEKYDLNFLMFVDDIWPMHDVELVKTFCDAYKEKVDLPFSVNLQVMTVKEESFAMAVDAGLRNICVGVESGNARIRKEILKRNYRDENVTRVFDLAHKHKIRCSSFNIMGLPEETREEIFDTINLNRVIRPHSATVTFFHPYRGAPMRKLCIERGYIDPDQGKHEDIYRSESQLDMPQITKKEL